MSNSGARVRFTDYVTRHHPKLVQEFSTTRLPPDELSDWAAFKLVVQLDDDGCIAEATDIAFVDDEEPEPTAAGQEYAVGSWDRTERVFSSFVGGSRRRAMVFALLMSFVGGAAYVAVRYDVVDADSAYAAVGGIGAILLLYATGSFLMKVLARSPQARRRSRI